MALALAIASFLSYVPGLNKVFLTRPIPVEHWFLPIAFALGILLLDEARKTLNRAFPKSILARLAW
jgi:sodium/potassium-transporting ATPase subunit alpha